MKLNKCLCGVLLAAAIGCLSSFSLQAQEVRTLFVNMPDSLSPLLTKVNRADCIDFLDSKMRAVVENRLGSKSEMTALTADYIRVKLSASTSWQMKVLSLNDSTRIIGVVATACAPAADSEVQFYSTDWKPLEVSSFLTLPVLTDFFCAPAGQNEAERVAYQRACHSADMLLMEAEFAPDAPELVFTFTTPDYLTKEAAEKLKPYLKKPLLYRWNQGRFVRKDD